MTRWLIGPVAALLVAAGCNSPNSRLNAPPHGEPYDVVGSQGTFVYMMDNALLADMTVSDSHFYPHRAMLTSLGTERLSRLASLMQAYGGSLRFNSNLPAGDLLSKRLETIHDFLGECGVLTEANTVSVDLPGGEGMNATEAILIRKVEGTYTEKKAQKQQAAADANKGDEK